jgi:YegS/Rv2252/BmrU family lipid kinase
MSVAIIINPIAGGLAPRQARRRAELAASVVDAHGDRVDVLFTERRGHARELARGAVARGARLVMAWGGDGTINEVASALAFGDVPMALIPAGSGNGLARELGVSFRAPQAIADALGAAGRPIDVGEINGRLFVNVAGVGFDAHVAAAFDERGACRRGFAGYAAVVARALVTYESQHYTITTAAARRVPRAVLVTVANSPQFGNGARIAPGARLDDGLLDLVVVEEQSRWRTLRHVPRLFAGSVGEAAGVSICRVTEAVIESEQPMAFHVDGETVDGGTRLAVRIHPAALRIAVR